MNLLDLIKKELLKFYLKFNYYKFCRELSINKQYIKIIKNKYSFYLFEVQYLFIKDVNDFKNRILHLYISILFEELRIDSTCFVSYMDRHSYNIEILDLLLHDRNYKYNTFLFENLLLLNESLKDLYFQLDSIDNLQTFEAIKNIELKKQIYKRFNSFFAMVNKLYLRRCS